MGRLSVGSLVALAALIAATAPACALQSRLALQTPRPRWAAAKPLPRGMPLRTNPPSMLAALPSAALGGTFAGGLHAITGPDHLAALLPLCVGRRWYSAAFTGALWGLGHGLGAALVGALGFALRGGLNLDAVSAYMEVAVGFSLLVIGITGARDSLQWASEVDSCELDLERRMQSDFVMADEAKCQRQPTPSNQAVSTTLINGIINGVSGTGHVLGVMPALTMPSWVVAGAYLGCFGVGTFVAMAIFTGLAGELSWRRGSQERAPGTPSPAGVAPRPRGRAPRAAAPCERREHVRAALCTRPPPRALRPGGARRSQLGAQLEAPHAPARLAMAASVFALGMGALWIRRAVVALGLPAAVLARLRL